VYGAIGPHNIAKEGTNWDVLRVRYICKFGGYKKNFYNHGFFVGMWTKTIFSMCWQVNPVTLPFMKKNQDVKTILTYLG
jgi:hypothetical protein